VGLIRAHFNFLLKNIEIEHLHQHVCSYNLKIITRLVIPDITSHRNSQRQIQKLLFLIARKPRALYDQFLVALRKTGQTDVLAKFNKVSAAGRV